VPEDLLMTERRDTKLPAVKTPAQKLYFLLRRHDVDVYASLPCKLLDEFIALLASDRNIVHTPVTREEEGLGILAGAALAGRRGALVMQNSGLGNCVNAIRSLIGYYQLPVVFVISHRGTAGETIEAQKPMGMVTGPVLSAIRVAYHEIKAPSELPLLDEAIPRAFEREAPVAFLFPLCYWEENH
jgi:sulfopyruvate decarboxylase subunit alpha